MTTQKINKSERTVIIVCILIILALSVSLFFVVKNSKRKTIIYENDKTDQFKITPLPSGSITDLLLNFRWFYLDGEVNEGLVVVPLKIGTGNLLSLVDTTGFRHYSDTGIVLHYLIDTAVSGEVHFTYALAKAWHDKENDVFASLGLLNMDDRYLLLTKDGYEIIDQRQLDSGAALYGRIKINTFPTAGTMEIKDLSEIHPRSCFYPGRDVYRFLEDNKDTMPDHLSFHFGAYSLGLGEEWSFKVQTPILVLTKNNGPLLGNTMLDFTKPYMNMAMDIGRLCPPACKDK